MSQLDYHQVLSIVYCISTMYCELCIVLLSSIVHCVLCLILLPSIACKNFAMGYIFAHVGISKQSEEAGDKQKGQIFLSLFCYESLHSYTAPLRATENYFWQQLIWSGLVTHHDAVKAVLWVTLENDRCMNWLANITDCTGCSMQDLLTAGQDRSEWLTSSTAASIHFPSLQPSPHPFSPLMTDTSGPA